MKSKFFLLLAFSLILLSNSIIAQDRIPPTINYSLKDIKGEKKYWFTKDLADGKGPLDWADRGYGLSGDSSQAEDLNWVKTIGNTQSYFYNGDGVLWTVRPDGKLLQWSLFEPVTSRQEIYKMRQHNLLGGNYLVWSKSQDTAMFTFDFFGWKFRMAYLPRKADVTVRGDNYLIVDADKYELYTIDIMGQLNARYGNKELGQVKSAGGTFFFTKEKLFTVDSFGYWWDFKLPLSYENKQNGKTNRLTSYNDVAIAGSNYLITTSGNIIAFTRLGVPVLDTIVGPVAVAEIAQFGGNFFYSRQGMLTTIGSDGTIYTYAHDDAKTKEIGGIKNTGLNYFVSTDGILYTVDYAGIPHSQKEKGKFDDLMATNFLKGKARTK
ncbi:MAG: hypothetical protein WCG27_08525 [Pseudomonadota bacterium]